MFINIGFGNVVSSEKIVAIVSPAAAPVKRMIQEARESGLLVDASCGRHTRSVITCDSRQYHRTDPNKGHYYLFHRIFFSLFLARRQIIIPPDPLI